MWRPWPWRYLWGFVVGWSSQQDLLVILVFYPRISLATLRVLRVLPRFSSNPWRSGLALHQSLVFTFFCRVGKILLHEKEKKNKKDGVQKKKREKNRKGAKSLFISIAVWSCLTCCLHLLDWAILCPYTLSFASVSLVHCNTSIFPTYIIFLAQFSELLFPIYLHRVRFQCVIWSAIGFVNRCC